MRWLKFGILFVIFLVGIYALSMTFVQENKKFSFTKEINYPIDKVFPQFNNLQKFSRWNDFFTDQSKLSFNFYTPYEGQGSSMSFQDENDTDIFGDLYIRYENLNKTLRYQLFEGRKNNPYLIDVKFIPKGEKTTIVWYFQTPKQPLLKRSLNLLSEDHFAGNLDKSMKNLAVVLGNKIDKDKIRENLKFDSIMVEDRPIQLLLGINVNSKTMKNMLFDNMVMSYNKTLNYVKTDLDKKEDEYGEPTLITNPANLKEKEISYFFGVPLSKKVPISDNNFSFRTINASKNFVMYYRGSYNARTKSIQQLLQKAKTESLRTGDLQETFLEQPSDEKNTVLKLSIPVFP